MPDWTSPHSKRRSRTSSSWVPSGSRPEVDVEVQIFGVRKSADTRAALRFFAERRIRTHFVDLNERAASVGELRRFATKFGAQALIDLEGKRFAELGLKSAQLSEERWLERLSVEPLLLRMPLVRHQQQLTVGPAEESWRAWVAATRTPA
ncbi:MAG: arsenate reductase [Gemmatimonadetes bacterium]|nr:MAG: arsenate reductase [Gemmatimonadota bacterium]PYP97967.1 MAG: arsenate reductase [Gemmatimonadota bacterium]